MNSPGRTGFSADGTIDWAKCMFPWATYFLEIKGGCIAFELEEDYNKFILALDINRVPDVSL